MSAVFAVKIVEDVFASNGQFTTRRTTRGTDDSCDIILLEHSSGEQILVECKKYASDRRVGVSVVRHMLGVMLLEKRRHAKIVTSSRFTEPAREAVIDASLEGYRIDLVDASALAKELGVYNERLPPLDAIDLSSFSTTEPM